VNPVDKKLIAAMRARRAAEGLSLRALSALINVSFSTLARIERGEGAPDHNSRIRILNWLGSHAIELGIDVRDVALVHFRASKNIGSKAVQCLVETSEQMRCALGWPAISIDFGDLARHPHIVLRSKQELEAEAAKFRSDLDLGINDRLDPDLLQVDAVQVITLEDVWPLGHSSRTYLEEVAVQDWSAMSAPLDTDEAFWVVLINVRQSAERRRVTLLEEYWHIMLGHHPTKVAKIGGAYGRTYEAVEEHDAFYLAAASMLPPEAVQSSVAERCSAEEIARKFGTSKDLVEYRIKRLGLWNLHMGREIRFSLNKG
jgi:transcriptional regulator with XRE-family HTH domain